MLRCRLYQGAFTSLPLYVCLRCRLRQKPSKNELTPFSVKQLEHSARHFASSETSNRKNVTLQKARRTTRSRQNGRTANSIRRVSSKVEFGRKAAHTSLRRRRLAKDSRLEAARTRVAARRIGRGKVGDGSISDQPGQGMASSGISLKRAIGPDSELQQASIQANGLSLGILEAERNPVPTLSNGLDKVLFNPGVFHVRDPRTGVFNFDPSLEEIMPVHEFDFNTLTLFISPSRDNSLAKIAINAGHKYVASTSSTTGVLKHFHYLLSQFRPPNFAMLSRTFPVSSLSYTKVSRAPEALFLRWRNGVYAVDADKEYDTANVLSLMGRYMEKLLTLDKETFERHRVGKSHQLGQQRKLGPEAYHYSTIGDFVLRSQLDAHDSRLPGTGMFDLKTRAVVPVRMDSQDYKWGTGYEIRKLQGEWESFEREYHDMIRSTMLKYSLQVRMGRMDGIFVAFHNITRIFGFQYVGLDEMDKALHGQADPALGDEEFLASMLLLNKIFDRATKEFPKQTIRFHFETRETSEPFMYIFAEPMSEEAVDAIQTKNRDKVEEWEREILRQPIQRTEDIFPRDILRPDGTNFGVMKDNKNSAMPPESQSEENIAKLARSNIEEDVTSELIGEGIMARDRRESVNDSRNDSSVLQGVESIDENNASTQEADQPKATQDKVVQPDSPPNEGLGRTEQQCERDETGSGSTNENEKPASNTDAPADRDFLEKFQSQEPRGPLLGLLLSISSTVNGKTVRRPSNLNVTDKWDINYTLGELKSSRVWELYNALKMRRAKEFAPEDKTDDRDDPFRRTLRNLAEKGRQWRERMEADEAAKGKVGIVTMWNDSIRSLEGQQAVERHPGYEIYGDLGQEHAGVQRVLENAMKQARNMLRQGSPHAMSILDDKISRGLTMDEIHMKIAAEQIRMARKHARALEGWAANQTAHAIVKEVLEEQQAGDLRQTSMNVEVPSRPPAVESDKA